MIRHGITRRCSDTIQARPASQPGRTRSAGSAFRSLPGAPTLEHRLDPAAVSLHFFHCRIAYESLGYAGRPSRRVSAPARELRRSAISRVGSAARSAAAPAAPDRRQRARHRGDHQCRLRNSTEDGDADCRGLSESGGDSRRAEARTAVDEASRSLGIKVVSSGTRACDAAPSRRGRHHRALELSAVHGRRPACGCAGRGQPGHGQDVGVHAGLLTIVRRSRCQDLRAGRTRCHHRWRRISQPSSLLCHSTTCCSRARRLSAGR